MRSFSYAPSRRFKRFKLWVSSKRILKAKDPKILPHKKKRKRATGADQSTHQTHKIPAYFFDKFLCALDFALAALLCFQASQPSLLSSFLLNVLVWTLNCRCFFSLQVCFKEFWILFLGVLMFCFLGDDDNWHVML